MNKLIYLSLALAVFSLGLNAQPKELVIKKDGPQLYLEHSVVAKENYYSLGRLYNLHPKTIAGYNKLDMKGLDIGQKLKIPLTDSNFIQKGFTGTPVYHKNSQASSVTKIGTAYRNVSPDLLKQWNHLSGDEVPADTKLVVGFLVTKEMPSITITPAPVKSEEVVAKEPEPVKPEPIVEKKVVTEEPVKKPEPVVVKEEVIPTTEQGFFKSSFEQQVRLVPIKQSSTVTSSVFKSSGGWQDAKYYMLMDKVQPGTVVRLTNPANNMIIYAKVLGKMSGIAENEGLDIRISNAAASALQVTETDKFIMKLNY